MLCGYACLLELFSSEFCWIKASLNSESSADIRFYQHLYANHGAGIYIYIPTWLPLSKITQFCRFFIYQHHFVRIWVILDLQWFSWFFYVFLMISHGFHRDFPWDFLAIFDCRWVPAPLRASRKVTLRLASSKKLRSESKVNTLHIIYKIYRCACIYIL